MPKSKAITQKQHEADRALRSVSFSSLIISNQSIKTKSIKSFIDGIKKSLRNRKLSNLLRCM